MSPVILFMCSPKTGSVNAKCTLGSALVFPAMVMPETVTVMPKPLHHGQQMFTSLTQAASGTA